ncbi:lysis system i-spanin subunit Rz, partial [Escherichia coli]|uniref:lysis system i-spanin subunit Rz n=1 Tax=Escherichia coli TaxID=562 RepID=UPI003D785FED
MLQGPKDGKKVRIRPKHRKVTITDMHERQRDADALDARYSRELAHARAENE